MEILFLSSCEYKLSSWSVAQEYAVPRGGMNCARETLRQAMQWGGSSSWS